MYNDSGRKVKVFALALFPLSVIAAIASYVVLLYRNELYPAIYTGLGVAFGGFLAAVILYALGEATDKANRAAYYCEQLAKAANKNGDVEIPILEDKPIKLSAKAFAKWLNNACKKIFGYSVMITLLGGGLTMLCYVVALIAGGKTAAKICDITYNVIWPMIIKTANVTIVIGLIAMYLNGDKALSPSEKKKKLTKNNDAEGTDE